MRRTILAIALLLGFADLAAAQRIVIGTGGYGGGRHYHGSGTSFYVAPGRFYLNTGDFRLGIGGGGYDSYRYGPGYGGYSYSPYDYYAPRPLYVPAAPSTYYVPAPAPAPVVAANRGKLRIILPDPEADLSIDGTKMKTTGRVRIFDTPEIEPGYTYWFKLTAMWNEKGETIADVRQVQVTPGTLSVVDFTQPETGETPAPGKRAK